MKNANINADFIERYQMIYQKDPNSKVFAPLAEAYRKMGLREEAFRICEAGVQRHPNFPSGRVALAKILIEKNLTMEAIEHLRAAVELAPENILAHSLLGECHLTLRSMKEALRAFKMTLFLNPNDTRAYANVKKLEALTADEYGEEVFAIRKIQEVGGSALRDDERPIEGSMERPSIDSPNDRPLGGAAERNYGRIEESSGYLAGPSGSSTRRDSLTQQRILERHLSLSDAYIVRNDIENAVKTLERARDQIGNHPEIDKRRKLWNERYLAGLTQIRSSKETLRPEEKQRRSIEFLQRLLKRVEQRRIVLA